MTDIYKKDLYLNPDVMFAFNTEITEFDIHDAGFSLTREYNLLPETETKKLEGLPKRERHVKIGKLQRKNKEYTTQLKNAFIDIRRRFFEENNVDETKVISIKKDAIFMMEPCSVKKFGTYVEFRDKNKYSSYIRLPDKTELYYHNGQVDVKGISDDVIHKHDKGMLEIISNTFRLAETDTRDVQLRYLCRIATKYKNLDLPVDCYREFNNLSQFVEKDPDNPMTYDDYWEDSKANLEIRYNYFGVIIPLIKILT